MVRCVGVVRNPCDKTELSAPSHFNRVAILRYTQGAWILTRGERVVTSLRSELAALGMVLSAGRSEDSLPVVLRAGRWLHDGVIGCGDLTDGRHRLRLDSFVSAEARHSRTGTGEAGAGGR